MPTSGASRPTTKRTPAKKTAARSGNPARKAAATPPAPPSAAASAADFKKAGSSNGGLVQMPSGHWVRLRRPGLPALISEGLLADSLSSLAQDAIEQGRSGKKIEQASIDELASDPVAIAKLMTGFEKIVVRCWAEPKVLPTVDSEGNFIDEVDRDPMALYANEVDLNDQIFTFSFAVGGDADLDRFRAELGQPLGALSAGTPVEGATQRTARAG